MPNTLDKRMPFRYLHRETTTYHVSLCYTSASSKRRFYAQTLYIRLQA